MSKPNGKPISALEVTLPPRFDLEEGEEKPLPKKFQKKPHKFTEEIRRQILLVFKAGLPIETAAAAVKIHPGTLKKWLYRGEIAPDDAEGIEKEFKEFYLSSLSVRAQGLLGMRQLLGDWATQDPATARWLAEKLYREVFGKSTTRIEHTGEGGGPIQVNVKDRLRLEKFSDDELEQLIRLQEKGADVVDAEVIE